MLQSNHGRMKAFARASTFNNDYQIVELVNYRLEDTLVARELVLKEVI